MLFLLMFRLSSYSLHNLIMNKYSIFYICYVDHIYNYMYYIYMEVKILYFNSRL